MSRATCPVCGTESSAEHPRCMGCGAAMAGAQTLGRHDVASHDAQASTPELAPGSRLGPYWIEATLGRGSSGVVLRARHATTGQLVAIKRLRPELALGPARQRVLREAKLLSAVDHPHVARLLDVVEEPTAPALVMELCAGRSLTERLVRGPLAAASVAKLLEQLASALDTLASLGVVHRDVTPNNLLVDDDDQLKLTDFGLARTLEARPGSLVTEAGIVLGTPAYGAPEVVCGDPATPASDRWSVGVILYEMVTGKRLFARGSRVATATAILNHDPATLALDGCFAATIRTLTAQSPAERGRSLRETIAGSLP